MPNTPSEALISALARLQNGLDAAMRGQTTTGEFCRHLRADVPAFATLPPRYTEVLNTLLDRLESSALFTEESCSFSQRDQFASLQMWLDKARQLAG